MDYRELLKEENDAVRERYALSMERIRAMEEETQTEPYGNYFRKTAGFIRQIEQLAARVEGKVRLEEQKLAQENRELYEDVLPEHYETSYANPAYSVRQLGEEYGRLLSFLYAEIRGDIVYAFEMRLADITFLNETFIEVYNLFQQAAQDGLSGPEPRQVQDILYWHMADYAERTVEWRVREGVDPSLTFALDVVMNADLEDLSYLYQYGEYISDEERRLAAFMNQLSQEQVNQMADTYTQGFCRGFQVMGRDLSRKSSVVLEYHVGFERMIRRAVENFRAVGLKPIIYRAAVGSLNRRTGGKRGYFGASPNRQYEYDHRFDCALYMGGNLKERKLAATRNAYETYKELAAACAGPAVVETFGEAPFQPVNKPEAYSLSEHQEEVVRSMNNQIRQIVNQYMPGDETSFTIIAFPMPEIGDRFPEIFQDTIRINTLDYDRYQKIQQKIIDELDKAAWVEILGRGANETCMHVQLHHLKDREKETNFENCVADVNIPLGEVFTSPVLEGTQGLLHVGMVYVDDYQFRNLRMKFAEGRVTEFSCENFRPGQDWEEQGKQLVKQVIMRGHSWLPLGEFAIGTNTAAYAMARRYQIGSRLPILIAEKTGPHFAVGDTCYSFSEDAPMYNPNGKEVIARDNEISILRREDPSKAYFSCHTDITIPYDELGSITAVAQDGTRTDIIRDGKFVLEGTEELNEPLFSDLY